MRARLAQAAGADAVRDGEASGFRFADGVAPKVVVAPATAEHAAGVLAACSAEGWRTVCAGGGTWLHAGRRDAVDVVLTTERLARAVAHSPVDLTASVAAGTPLHALQSACATHRQHWPVDPPAGRTATAGAVAAMASAGPARFSSGTPRDHVLGLELVTGDGRVLRLGGRVVKNVAGYDLVRLAVGSAGRLGLITRLELRLRSLPEDAVTAVYSAPEPDPLIELATRAGDAWPDAIELVSPPVAHAALDTLHWTLLVRCAGNRAFVSEANARLDALLPGRCRILTAAEAESVWTRLRAAEVETSVLIRLAGLPAALRTSLAVALEITGDDAGRWRVACHAGDGIVRTWRSDPIDGDRAARLALAIDRARETWSASRIRVTMPVVPATMPRHFEPAPMDATTRRLTRAIAAVFDPAGILGPPDTASP